MKISLFFLFCHRKEPESVKSTDIKFFIYTNKCGKSSLGITTKLISHGSIGTLI